MPTSEEYDAANDHVRALRTIGNLLHTATPAELDEQHVRWSTRLRMAADYLEQYVTEHTRPTRAADSRAKSGDDAYGEAVSKVRFATLTGAAPATVRAAAVGAVLSLIRANPFAEFDAMDVVRMAAFIADGTDGAPQPVGDTPWASVLPEAIPQPTPALDDRR